MSGGLLGFAFSRNLTSLSTGVLYGGGLLALSTLSLKIWRQGKSSFPYILGQAGTIHYCLQNHWCFIIHSLILDVVISEPRSLCAHECISKCLCYLLKLLCLLISLKPWKCSAFSCRLLEELHILFYGIRHFLYHAACLNLCLLDFNCLMLYLCRLRSCFLLGFLLSSGEKSLSSITESDVSIFSGFM